MPDSALGANPFAGHVFDNVFGVSTHTSPVEFAVAAGAPAGFFWVATTATSFMLAAGAFLTIAVPVAAAGFFWVATIATRFVLAAGAFLTIAAADGRNNRVRVVEATEPST